MRPRMRLLFCVQKYHHHLFALRDSSFLQFCFARLLSAFISWGYDSLYFVLVVYTFSLLWSVLGWSLKYMSVYQSRTWIMEWVVEGVQNGILLPKADFRRRPCIRKILDDPQHNSIITMCCAFHLRRHFPLAGEEVGEEVGGASVAGRPAKAFSICRRTRGMDCGRMLEFEFGREKGGGEPRRWRPNASRGAPNTRGLRRGCSGGLGFQSRCR